MGTSLPHLNERGLSNNKPIKTLDKDTATINLNKNNEEVIEEVNEEVNEEPSATTTISIVDEIKISTRKQRKRINVSMDEEIFDKLITVANGKSVSNVMERILIDAVKHREIDRAIVIEYKNKMKNKGCKE